MSSFHVKQLALSLVLLTASSAAWAQSEPRPAAAPAPGALTALPELDLARYQGVWYQVAWFPNRFQRQCVSDTRATYTRLPSGGVQVLNECRLANGQTDSVVGLARPSGSRIEGERLIPAQLEVSFLPAWLRWLPIWGNYWVIQRADDGRYAVISEPTRAYLWVLARSPQLPAADIDAIRSRLLQQGFDLAAWQLHPHTAAPLPEPVSRRPATPAPEATR